MIDVSPNLKQFLQTEVEPRATECDGSFNTLNRLFNLQGQRGLFALTLQGELKNQPLSKKSIFDNKALETKTSGALSFLTSQISLSGSLIYSGQHRSKDQYLLQIMQGKLKIANAVSHLRNDPEIVKVQRQSEGYIVNGRVNWITGYQHLDYFILGFKYDKKEYFALLSFSDSQGIQFTDPIRVMVMQATQTVTVCLTDFFIADDQIINRQDEGNWNQKMKMGWHTLPYFYGIGMGALEVAQEKYQQPSSVIHTLNEKLNALREQITQDIEQDYIDLRVKITQCAWQCLQCAVTVSKGQAMDPNSKISRLYREIVQFNALAAIPEYIDRSLT